MSSTIGTDFVKAQDLTDLTSGKVTIVTEIAFLALQLLNKEDSKARFTDTASFGGNHELLALRHSDTYSFYIDVMQSVHIIVLSRWVAFVLVIGLVATLETIEGTTKALGVSWHPRVNVRWCEGGPSPMAYLDFDKKSSSHDQSAAFSLDRAL